MSALQAAATASPAVIRALNDALRIHHRGGSIVTTSGIVAMPDDEVAAILKAVAAFDDFGPDNDPYGEHDFGALEVSTHRIFWKIDYYDRSLTGGSKDPADPAKTHRVLTIMLAEEY
jgi:hypothetical protein